MKQLKLLLILLLFLPLLVNASQEELQTCDCNYLIYSKFEANTNEWTNMTLNTDTYEVSSDNPDNDGFASKLLMSPWNAIDQQLEASNFFDTQIKEKNPHTVIEVKSGERSNIQEISHINIKADDLQLLLDSILFRYSGYGQNAAVWPTDIQIMVMESYPEQYGITVSFQRGNDLLDYVHEENATLIVSDQNVFSEPSTPENPLEAIYVDSQLISIDAGGFSTTFEFNTFSVGTAYRPSSLHFTVIMDNGVFLYLGNATQLPVLNYQNYNTYDILLVDPPKDNSSDTSGSLELPINILVIIGALMIIPVLRKKFQSHFLL